MKHLLKSTLFASAAIVFATCSGNESSTSNNETKKQDHTTMEETETGTAASPVLKNDQLNAVYQHYIHLTTALTNNDMTEAKVAANAIEAGTNGLAGASAVAAAASQISTASGIEPQRTAYASMSREMEKLIKREGLSSGQLYVDFCPMALDNKGATWITANKEIRNPYFGDKMLECGEVQDTFK